MFLIQNLIFVYETYNDIIPVLEPKNGIIQINDFCKYNQNQDINYEEIIDEILLKFMEYIEIQKEILDKYKISPFYFPITI